MNYFKGKIVIICREIKQTDSRLDSLERRVEDEAKHFNPKRGMEAKHAVDILEQEISSTEQVIQSLFNDVQILREGRYPQAGDLYKKVTKLHQRWVALRSMFHTKLLMPLSNLSFPIEERTITRQTRTVLETRHVDTNPHFRLLQETTEWCRNKLVCIFYYFFWVCFNK